MAVRVASLLRLSTKKQAKRQGEGDPDIPAQRNAIVAYVASKTDWHLVREFKEEGSAFSNSAEERDILQGVLREAKSGAFDVLLMWKGDRLSRIVDELPTIVKQLTKMGVQVWSVVDAPGGKQWNASNALELLMLALEGFKNQSESENTSIRVRARMRQLAEEGNWSGSRVPFGYQLVARKDGRGEPLFRGGRPIRDLLPHAEFASVVQELFRRYLAGQGYLRLAEWLNSINAPTFTNSGWNQKTVKDVIKNPIYAGVILYGRTEGVLGTKERRSGVAPITAKGKHVPLVDQGTWEEAQRLRQARASMPALQQYASYPLAGVVRCAVCGAAMGGYTRKYTRQNGERIEYPVYRCLTHKASKRCSVTSYLAEEIEEAFVAALEEQFAAPTGLRAFLEQRETGAQAALAADEAARKRAQKRLGEIDTALKRLDRAYLEAGTVTDQEYREKKEEYQAERSGLHEDLARPPVRTQAKDVAALVEAVKDIRKNWPYLSPDERKAFALSITKAYELKALVYPDTTVQLQLVE